MEMYSIRRKKNEVKRGSIFPLVTQLEPDETGSKFEIFNGILVDNRVEIRDALGMKDIYNGGFFGRGSSSYGEPKFVGSVHMRVMARIHPEMTFEEKFDGESEALILSPCEAFFLSFALGVLVVREENGKNMTIDEAFAYFNQKDKYFPIKYAAYHHFRSKGWVVRCGLPLGVDFVLYKDGPPFSHSSFMVVIRTDESDRDYPPKAMGESQLDALLRIAENVKKTVLFCYVLRCPPCKLDMPQTMKTLKIVEVLQGHFDQKSVK